MKILTFFAILSSLLAGPGLASTFSSAYGSAFVDVTASDLNTGDPVDLIVEGDTSVQASALVTGANGIDFERDTATVTFTNPINAMVELYVDVSLVSDAYTEFLDGVLLTGARYDSNAYVEVNFYSTFASTNGSYSCSEPDYNVGAFDCFGVFEDGYDEIFLTPYYSLGAFESLTFEMEASAFAFIESTPAPVVPLPAGCALLLSGLGLLWTRRLVGV